MLLAPSDSPAAGSGDEDAFPSASGTADPTPLSAGEDAPEFINGSFVGGGGNLRVGGGVDVQTGSGPSAGASSPSAATDNSIGSKGPAFIGGIAAACGAAAIILAAAAIAYAVRRRRRRLVLQTRTAAAAGISSAGSPHKRRRKAGDAPDAASPESASLTAASATLMSPQSPLFAHKQAVAGSAELVKPRSAVHSAARDSKASPVVRDQRGAGRAQVFSPSSPASHMLALAAVPGAFSAKTTAPRGRIIRMKSLDDDERSEEAGLETVAEGAEIGSTLAGHRSAISQDDAGASGHHYRDLAVREIKGRAVAISVRDGSSATQRAAATALLSAAATSSSSAGAGAGAAGRSRLQHLEAGRGDLHRTAASAPAAVATCASSGDADCDGNADPDSLAGSDDALAEYRSPLMDPSIALARQSLTAEAAARINIGAKGQRVRGRPAAELTAAAIKRRLIQPRRFVAALSHATAASASVAAASAAAVASASTSATAASASASAPASGRTADGGAAAVATSVAASLSLGPRRQLGHGR